MAYWLTSFASTTIPVNLGDRGSMDVAAGVADAPLISLPGGRVFDPLGSTTAYRPSATFVARVMIVSDTPATIKSVLDSWQALIGTVGTLVRTADSGGSTHQLTARLMSATVLGRTVEGSRIVRMMLTFQAVSFPWQTAPSTLLFGTNATVSTTHYTQAYTNGGNIGQFNCQFIVTPTGGATMTSVTILNSNSGYQISYTGSVASGKQLAIDTATTTVTNDGVADYANFVPPTTSERWMLIPAGNSTFTYYATFSGGGNIHFQITAGDAWG